MNVAAVVAQRLPEQDPSPHGGQATRRRPPRAAAPARASARNLGSTGPRPGGTRAAPAIPASTEIDDDQRRTRAEDDGERLAGRRHRLEHQDEDQLTQAGTTGAGMNSAPSGRRQGHAADARRQARAPRARARRTGRTGPDRADAAEKRPGRRAHGRAADSLSFSDGLWSGAKALSSRAGNARGCSSATRNGSCGTPPRSGTSMRALGGQSGTTR